MQFSELVNFFSQLEGTNKRLALIEILSSLFRRIADPLSARHVVYLLQGRVAPFYEPVEFGMGDKLLERAIASAYRVSREQVDELYTLHGDIAEVALYLAEKHKFSGVGYRVFDVFEQLYSLTQISGEGAVDGKVTLLADLLRSCTPLESKYVMRIVSGRLRLGIGDPTILEALSLARFGDRSYRRDLEKAYNEISDLGYIAETLWLYEGDALLSALSSLRVAVGRPLRCELCERLPNPEATIAKMGTVVCQFKYDGFRTQMHLDRARRFVKLYSRNLEETTHSFPELVQGLFDQVDAESVILDAEAVAYHPDSEEFFPFQETTKRRRKYDIETLAHELPLRAFVFDILYKNGASLLDLPLQERLCILDKTIKKNVYSEQLDCLIVSESRIFDNAHSLAIMLEEALTRGLEGLVVKKINSPYEAGARNFNWVKLKHSASLQLKDTVDCVVLGYIYGRGKRTAFGVGALLVGVYDADRDVFVSISKIGTGLSDEEWVAVRARCDELVSDHKPARVESDIVPSVWVQPAVVVEVLADEITRSPLHTAGRGVDGLGYALRFPRLVSFRDKDKRPEDATSVSEIIALFAQQRKKDA